MSTHTTPLAQWLMSVLRVVARTAARPKTLGLFLVTMIALGLLTVWIIDRSQKVITSDARVAADMIALSADVSGIVTAVHVKVGDTVEAGELLFEIDDREPRLLLDEYQARIEALRIEIEQAEMQIVQLDSKSGTQVAAMAAEQDAARAEIGAAQSVFETRLRDFERLQTLLENGRVTQERVDQSRNELDTARQALQVAQAQLSSATARTRQAVIAAGDTDLFAQDLLILQANLRQAEAQRERQRVIISKHEIRSPINGVIDKLFFDPGERTLQGFRVALLHDPDDIWIAANIKETEIRHLQHNALVEIHIDSDPDTPVRGRIVTIGSSTVGEMALMPNPNATGVFTKITQRIPIKIELDSQSEQLRPGSMVRVSIFRSKLAD